MHSNLFKCISVETSAKFTARIWTWNENSKFCTDQHCATYKLVKFTRSYQGKRIAQGRLLSRNGKARTRNMSSDKFCHQMNSSIAKYITYCKNSSKRFQLMNMIISATQKFPYLQEVLKIESYFYIISTGFFQIIFLFNFLLLELPCYFRNF